MSKIGMNRISTGTASTGRRLRERPPVGFKSAEPARKKPMNIEPQSPMKLTPGFNCTPGIPAARPRRRRASGPRPELPRKVSPKEGGGDRGDAGRQPVHVVEQVDGVGDTDQPEEGDRHVDRWRSGPGQGQPAPNDRRRPVILPLNFW